MFINIVILLFILDIVLLVFKGVWLCVFLLLSKLDKLVIGFWYSKGIWVNNVFIVILFFIIMLLVMF